MRKVKNANTVAASGMDIAKLRCHAEAHWWDMVGDTQILTTPKGKLIEFTRNHRCARCGETRRVRRDAAFVVLSRAYTQPPGYKFARTKYTVGINHRYIALAELLKREGIKGVSL